MFKNKNLALSILVLIFQSFALLSQTETVTELAKDSEKATIIEAFTNYFKTVEEKNNAATIEYIYPKLFDHFPKDMLLMAMDEMYADTTILMSFESEELTNISDIISHDENKYALVDYNFNMNMIINDSDIDDDGDFSMMDFTYDNLKSTFGEKNVTMDKEKQRFDIFVENQLYVIQDAGTQAWKFLEKKPSMMMVIEKIFPAEIIEKLD